MPSLNDTSGEKVLVLSGLVSGTSPQFMIITTNLSTLEIANKIIDTDQPEVSLVIARRVANSSLKRHVPLQMIKHLIYNSTRWNILREN